MATQVEIAKHLDLSDRQVRNLLSEGVLPGSKGRGGFDMDACREAYIRYLRGLGSSQVKPEPGAGEEGIDPLIEYKLLEERRGLTAAQRIAQEKKNLVLDKQLVPVPFATFALAKIAAQIGSKLDTVGKTVTRRHPEVDPRIIESVEREIALARNIAASFGEQLPELLDEYAESVAE